MIFLIIFLFLFPPLLAQVSIGEAERLYCTFEQCGADGFDLEDDSEAIAEALALGLPVFGQEGATYILREPISLERDVYISSSGGPFTFLCEASTNLIKIAGSESLLGQVTISAGEECFLLSGGGLEPGDLLKIESTARDWPYDATPSRDYRKGGIYRVRATAKDTVFVYSTFPRNIAAAAISKINPVSVRLENVNIEYTGARGGSPLVGLDLRYLSDSELVDCSIAGGIDHGLLIAYSAGLSVSGCTFQGATHDQNGFGAWVGSSIDVSFSGCTFRDFFKGVDFSGFKIPCRRSSVSGCTFYGGGKSYNERSLYALGQRAISSHAIAEDVTASHNTFVDCYAGIVASGPGFNVIDNRMIGRANTFAQIRYCGEAVIAGNLTPSGLFRFVHIVSMAPEAQLTIKSNQVRGLTSYFLLNNTPGARVNLFGNEIDFISPPGYMIYGGGINGVQQNNIIRGL